MGAMVVLCDNARQREDAPIVILMPIFGLLVGLSVAFAARRQIRLLSPSWRRAYLVSILIYMVLIWLPVGMFFFITYPTWSVLYLTEPPGIHASFGLIIIVISTVASVIGYQLGEFLLHRALDRHLIASMGLCVLGLFLVLVVAGSRLGSVAEFGDWREAESLSDTVLGSSLLFMLPLVLGGWIYLLVYFEREGRKVESSRSVSMGDQDETFNADTGTSAQDYSAASSEYNLNQENSETADHTGGQISDSRILEDHFFSKGVHGKR